MTTPSATQVVQGEVLAERRPSLAAPIGAAVLLAVVLVLVLFRAASEAPRPGEAGGPGCALEPPGLAGPAVGGGG